MNKQNLMKMLGSLFVAIILVLSYAAYGSSNTSTTTQSTTVNQNYSAYWHAVNYTTVSIANLNNVFTVQTNCTNQAAGSLALNQTYARILALNSSIAITQIGNQLLVNTGTISPRYVYSYAESGLNVSERACTLFNMKAAIIIPSRLRFRTTYIFSTSVTNSALLQIPSNMRSYSFPITLSNSMANTTSVTIVALLTSSFQILGNLSVSVS